jgi:anti-anti-sigma regulatory factor
MASNFKIFQHQNSDSFHLKIIGDFDGSSAHQLIRELKNHKGNARHIYIHTSTLTFVHPFGIDVLNIIGQDRNYKPSKHRTLERDWLD